MATVKSPFIIIENFISLKQCEQIVDDLECYSPDVDPEGNPIKMFKFHQQSEEMLFNKLQTITPNIMKYYDTEYRGTEQIIFEYLAEGTQTKHICENSSYIKKKWTRVKDRDITCLLFLSDYNENVPFDTDYEVYGGNLEFPQHQFNFRPNRGTLIIYPSGPHFINVNAPVRYGDLYQARIHIATKSPFMYQPNNFPGDYKSWLQQYM